MCRASFSASLGAVNLGPLCVDCVDVPTNSNCHASPSERGDVPSYLILATEYAVLAPYRPLPYNGRIVRPARRRGRAPRGAGARWRCPLPDRRGDFSRISRLARRGRSRDAAARAPGRRRAAAGKPARTRIGNRFPNRDGSRSSFDVIHGVILILIAPVAARPGRAGPGRMRIVSDGAVPRTSRLRTAPAVPPSRRVRPRAAPSRSTDNVVAHTSIRVRRTNRLIYYSAPPTLLLCCHGEGGIRGGGRDARARAPATAHGGRGGTAVVP